MAMGNSSDPGTYPQSLIDDPDFLREIVERTVQALLETEMSAHLGAERYERGEERRGYRNGTKPRTLVTRVGTLQLAVPQDRDGTFSTDFFARYQRNEQALVSTLMEMSLKGDSTRKVTAITEEPALFTDELVGWRSGGVADPATRCAALSLSDGGCPVRTCPDRRTGGESGSAVCRLGTAWLCRRVCSSAR